ncbi:hypothetical protein EVAR_98884_1 [Eumeta japonica]|uniref:Uncharacterized protein n=1 Tax=Eumeta variegata TaxID=151549 RepID=A0A4C2A521_EUMVA|nr:hypothetical protein EVAR_98884_1 [Eumeta japonica]
MEGENTESLFLSSYEQASDGISIIGSVLGKVTRRRHPRVLSGANVIPARCPTVFGDAVTAFQPMPLPRRHFFREPFSGFRRTLPTQGRGYVLCFLPPPHHKRKNSLPI